MTESFKQRLRKSGQKVLDERAQILYQSVSIEEQSFMNALQAEVLRIKAQIAQHNDVAVKSRDSLVPGGDSSFNGRAWIEKRHSLQMELRDALIRLKVATQVDTELFPKDEQETININDINTEE